MSDLEIADLENARRQLENYDRLYTLVEYTSKLHEGITCLERKIQTNNPTIPMNIWRQCGANNEQDLFTEMEAYMQAYYDLLDDCKDFPLWHRKFQEDLGQSVSFLGIMMEESLRDDTMRRSPIFERFDAEKQVYFK